MSTSYEEIQNYKPKTRRYGYRDSSVIGSIEDTTRCFEELHEQGKFGWLHNYQCHRKRGYGPKGLFCKQHAKRYAKLEEDE